MIVVNDEFNLTLECKNKPKDLIINFSLFLLNKNKLLENETDLIFYNNTKSTCNNIKLINSDEEYIIYDLNLSSLNNNIVEILGLITFDDDNFKNITTLKLKCLNIDYDIKNIENSISILKFIKIDNIWYFDIIDIVSENELSYYVAQYYYAPILR